MITITNDMLDFFELCAKGQEVTKEVIPRRTYIYDNRVDHIPAAAEAAFAILPRERLVEWFTIFIALKFRFLSSLLQGSDNVETIANAVDLNLDKPQWKNIITAWDSQGESERLAYLYRISQLKPEVVHQEWYNTTPEFLQWSRVCRALVQDCWQTFVSQGFADSYPELWDKLENVSNLTFEDDHILTQSHSGITNGLRLTMSAVLSHLTCLDSPRDKIALLQQYFKPAQAIPAMSATPIYKSIAMTVAEVLTANYIDMLRSGVVDEDPYLQVFTREMTKVFQCAICDYLDVIGGNVVRIRSTSLEIPEVTLRQALGDTETYVRGEGITGSILVDPKPGIGLHVGTNNLSNDPRLSPWHTSAYEKIYGPTYNFWVFPLFERGQMIGAFRVINRGGSREGVNGYWPYYVRVQLLETAQWFQLFWQIAKRLLGSMVPVHLTRPSEYGRIARQLIAEFDLSWVSEVFLERLLEHLRTVVHRKVEDQKVSCCIGVIEETDIDPLKRTLGKYTTVDPTEIQELNDTSKFYNRVSPIMGMFVFSGGGRFQGVLALQYPGGTRGIESVEKITENYKSLVLIVERSQESIRIFYKASLAAEYYLSHYTGSWKLRFYDDTLKKLREITPGIPQRVIDRVYKQAWHLSYSEIGSLLIVADKLPDSVKCHKTVPLEVPLDTLTETEFDDLARIDGAVTVSLSGIVTGAGAILAFDNPALHPDIERLLADAQKGARHRTAALVSQAAPTALVIVISKNRGISVFLGGNSIKWEM